MRHEQHIGVLSSQTGESNVGGFIPVGDPHEELVEGMVSVILVNYKGADDTITCLKYFDDVDWPQDQLELIVVDNNSGDDQDRKISEALPHVHVFQSGHNLGFAAGCNFGVARARGQYVAFLNNDARPDRGWVRAAVEAMRQDPTIGCVASRVLDWEGKTVDFVNSSLTWYGMGYKREVGQKYTNVLDLDHDVLFATGAAMFMPTALFRSIGGFDERFFMFYEDVDLGWRLNLLGYRVRYVSGSLAYHRHHASMDKFGAFRETYLLERNSLLCMLKNYADDTLKKTLGPAFMLALGRHFGKDKAAATAGGMTLQKNSLTGVYAIDYVREMLPSIMESRRELQLVRKVPDSDLFKLFGEAMESAFDYPPYMVGHEIITNIMGIGSNFRAKPRIMVVTGEPIKKQIAGPAIRAWQMANHLSRTNEVVLISTSGVELEEQSSAFAVIYCAGEKLKLYTQWADVIIFQGFFLEGAPWIMDQKDKVVVADVYDPIHLEQLEQARDLGPVGRQQSIETVTEILNKQITRADLLLCASAKQKDFWLGHAAVQQRLEQMSSAKEIDDFIQVVPFGLENKPLEQSEHGIRGKVPGIDMDDKVIIWGGGVYNWFDPLTLIKAVAKLAENHPDVRLYFMGMKHPNPGVPDMKIAFEAQELSKTLGLTNRHVFFNSDWVEYSKRGNVLADADLGVSTHFMHVETYLSFRTRILDYLWAGLPIVATVGDSFGNILDEEGIGHGVAPEDVDALVFALEDLLYNSETAAQVKTRVRQYADAFRWEKVLEPLIDFCNRPLLNSSPSRVRPMIDNEPTTVLPAYKGGLRGDLERAWYYLRHQGPLGLMKKTFAVLRRRYLVKRIRGGA